MATCSSILAWKIPWTEEPGGIQFMGSQKDMTEQVNIHYFYHPCPFWIGPVNFNGLILLPQCVSRFPASLPAFRCQVL